MGGQEILNAAEVAVEAASSATDVSLLDSLLMLLTPEERAHFLASAGRDGVLYANRAPVFNHPLALRLTKTAFLGLLEMLGRPATDRESCTYDDAAALEALKADLEQGVRLSPPPADWFADHATDDQVPIRLETSRFGIPCRLQRSDFGSRAQLLAVFLGAPDTKRPDEEQAQAPEVRDEEIPAEPEELEQLSAVETVAGPAASTREFQPHIQTTWQVLGPLDRERESVDGAALERLVLQVTTNRRSGAQRGAIREHCRMLQTLLRLKLFAAQRAYTLEPTSDKTLELRVAAPPDVLEKMERVFVYVDAGTDSRQLVPRLLLERIGRAGERELFQVPEGFTCDSLPPEGFLLDTGERSQLEKQLHAIRELSGSQDRPHILRLGELLGDGQPRHTAVAWDAEPLTPFDKQLTARQVEAVRKALTTPDVCLIQGPPGTGKTRVICEIVRQAVNRNERVLLVAPTHVAVDNVLERIGLQDDVSPIRCVRAEKLEDLDEAIQKFTWDRRAELVSDHSVVGVRQERETTRLQEAGWSRAVSLIERCLKSMKEVEGEIDELRDTLAAVPSRVRQQFAAEAAQVQFAEEQARRNFAAAQRSRAASQEQLARCEGRLADLHAGRYTDDDRLRFQAAEDEVHREQDLLIESARLDCAAADEAVRGAQAAASRVHERWEEAAAVLAALESGQIPPAVAPYVAAAVTPVQADRAPRLAALDGARARAQEERDQAEQTIQRLDRKAARARRRAQSLREAAAGSRWLRPLYIAWWGSFFQDYEATATDAASQCSQWRGQLPGLQERLRQAEHALRQAQTARDEAVARARQEVLQRQQQHYWQETDRLRTAVDEHQWMLDENQRQAVVRQQELERRTAHFRQALEEGRAAVHAELLKAAEQSRTAAQTELERTTAVEAAAEKHLQAAIQAAAEMPHRVQAAIDARSGELRGRIDGKFQVLSRLQQDYRDAVAGLPDASAAPAGVEDASALEPVLQRLVAEQTRARRRLRFLDEWTQFLERERERLKEVLAEHVNLVCATTVGIATDEHFGDAAPPEKKDFDLLVVDEAGKVTEPEFLVAAVRAKRWVLVGDHKQLPPFYDQALDPFLREADGKRLAAGQPTLDAAILRQSIFERLWQRLHPDQASDAATSETWAAQGEPDQEPDTGDCDDAPESAGASRCVTLDVQRRMHPDLALFISDTFYDGQYTSPPELEFARGKDLPLQHFPKAVTWIDVAPPKDSPGNEIDLSRRDERCARLPDHTQALPPTGYANLREAEQVLDALEAIVADPHLRPVQAAQDGLRDEPAVGIIALYAGQKELLHRLLASRTMLQAERLSAHDWSCRGVRVTINTVDAFQGKECPIIVLTFTRSNRRKAVGFVDDPNRLNVALSRAQRKLILVGDSLTLTRRARQARAGRADSDNSAETHERRVFAALVKYVEGRGNYMRIFQLRKAHA